MAKHAGQLRIIGVLSALALLTGSLGCTRSPIDTSPRTIPAATPASAPPVGQAPPGVVHPLGGHPQAAIFDAGSATLAVLVPGTDPQAPAAVAVFGSAGPRTIALPGPANALTGDDHGTAYLAGRGGYFVVDLAAGQARVVDVDEADDVDFTAIARRADGNLVLGSADGAVYTLASPNTVAKRHQIFARVDAIVTQGNTAVVLDRGQTSLTAITADGDPRHSLRAGSGTTNLATDPLGRVLATDTRGGQLLVFSVDPLIMRQAYPVPDVPYGLAGSPDLAWVSQTATNTVIGYDLSTGIPVEKVRYPTVQQPNSLAFDAAAGTLYVVSGSGAGVQVITGAGSPR